MEMSGDETPGLQTVSSSDSEWDDWYEPASASRNVTGGRGGLTWQAHCEFFVSF